jgi:hypothetical protein
MDYPRDENQVLKGQLRGRHVILLNNERRRLTVLGARLRRQILVEAAIVTPDAR